MEYTHIFENQRKIPNEHKLNRRATGILQIAYEVEKLPKTEKLCLKKN